MKYEKMRGKSVSECVTRIRREFGESAIIIEHREVNEGGMLGSGLFSKKAYEVDFMIPERDGGRSEKDFSFSPRKEGRPTTHESHPPATAARPVREERISDLKSTLKKLRDERARELEEVRASSESDDLEESLPARSNEVRETNRKQEESIDPTPNPDLLTDVSFTREEMMALMDIHDPATGKEPGTGTAEPSAGGKETRPNPQEQKRTVSVAPDRSLRVMSQLKEKLISARMSPEFAGHFLDELEENLSPAEKREYRTVESKGIDRLSSIIRTVPDIAPPRGECRAVMLVGPTGSGKTTTLAKLAAMYQIFQKREVSIYSLDHYRLAATEQLKFYASVIDVPFHAPLTPEAFQEDMRRDGAELMLIDTSGIGYRDTKKMEELKRFVEACEVKLEIHLTIPGGMDPAVIEKNLLAYDPVGFDKILITKLDETEFVGALVENADKFNRPFSFITNGQEVPGDIMEAGSLKMAKLVFNGL